MVKWFEPADDMQSCTIVASLHRMGAAWVSMCIRSPCMLTMSNSREPFLLEQILWLSKRIEDTAALKFHHGPLSPLYRRAAAQAGSRRRFALARPSD